MRMALAFTVEFVRSLSRSIFLSFRYAWQRAKLDRLQRTQPERWREWQRKRKL